MQGSNKTLLFHYPRIYEPRLAYLFRFSSKNFSIAAKGITSFWS